MISNWEEQKIVKQEKINKENKFSELNSRVTYLKNF